MNCPKCNSESCTTLPAEIRLYRNGPRTQSHPPVSPAPDIQICMDCGWSEFVIPPSWISAWIRPTPKRAELQPIASIQPLHPVAIAS